MAARIHRWVLLFAAIFFLAVGCANVAYSIDGERALPYLGAALFYCLVGSTCMSAHVRAVAGDCDDEETWTSY